jgi:hypothetical protein
VEKLQIACIKMQESAAIETLCLHAPQVLITGILFSEMVWADKLGMATLVYTFVQC